MSSINLDTVEINGTQYVRADQVKTSQPNGDRAVVVIDRGWIFAGDVTEEGGRILLARAVHVFKWRTGGFTLCVSDPKAAGADLRPCSDVDLPAGAEIFRVPVHDQWGLE